MAEPSVSAVVLAWKDEPWLTRCIEALLASTGVAIEVVIVDNGAEGGSVQTLEKFADHPLVTVVNPGSNLGFAGGCNFGARSATGDYLALVNGDLLVEPTTLRRLVDVVDGPGVGVAVASVRMPDDVQIVNAGANPVHVLGMSWAGGLGKPETRTGLVDTAAASGACLVTTRAHWQRLDGFDEEYFAYCEDSELSLRTWRLGLRCVYVPDAIATHRYEFSRNPFKNYLIERNRLMLVATLWSPRALVVLAPAGLAFEAVGLAVALLQGWGGAKVRGWTWLWRNRGHLRARRRQLRGEGTVPDREWMRLLRADVDAVFFPLPVGLGLLNAVMRGYWAAVRWMV
ncbi:glycosyltransferase family 2 protein [Rugosimonospora acidiphila]|uniref:Glycosyltransferase family 2 protein n=1 Tax=Rugosimonospora acidiphila TaxID=556531 RepID=A0ABP9SQV3_9ACTN